MNLKWQCRRLGLIKIGNSFVSRCILRFESIHVAWEILSSGEISGYCQYNNGDRMDRVAMCS